MTWAAMAGLGSKGLITLPPHRPPPPQLAEKGTIDIPGIAVDGRESNMCKTICQRRIAEVGEIRWFPFNGRILLVGCCNLNSAILTDLE